MKKIQHLLVIASILVGILILAGGAVPVWADPPVPAFGQMTCAGTPTQIYAGGNGDLASSRYRLLIVPITAGVTVWIAPGSTITTSNAGIPLSTTGLNYYITDSNPNQKWYCITSGAPATVGWTVLW